MKALSIILLMVMLAGGVWAQDGAGAGAGTNDAGQSIDQWMRENLDDSVVKTIGQVDQDRVRDFLNALQQRFADTNIFELGSLKEAADRALPVLEQFEETRPYASWLRTHLDYLDAANELERQMKTNGAAQPGGTMLPAAPPIKLERSVWVQELDARPWPPLAKTYVPRLKEIFMAEKVPPELVWMAEVESSFDTRARSPAGAAGMFQLMPETARAGKMSLWPRDERYQAEKSAHFAAQHLRELHKHYGDWALAFAAYDAGQGRVDRLLKRRGAHTFEAIARELPAETQMYVPKIEATIHKREGVAREGLKGPKA